MPKPGQRTPRKRYMLATGEEAANRLLLLDKIFGPATRKLLETAGLWYFRSSTFRTMQ